MESTNGLARTAEVWVGGSLLTVCDGVSRPHRPCPPGLLDDVKFSYMTAEAFSWQEAVRGNPSGRMRLDPQRRWSYVGYGRVVRVAPVVIDFGLLEMEDANWTTDEGLVGRFVRIEIDRLEIVPAEEPDWPEDMR